jgi:Viral BACON domain
MSNRVSKSNPLQVFFALVALALIVSLPSPLHAQTFQTVPALSFTMPFAGANPLPQIVTIATTSGALRFTPVASTSSGGNWLSVSPSNVGCCYAPYPVAVLVNGAGLAAGTYNGKIVFTDFSNSNNTMTVPVTLTVAASSAAFFDNLPGALTFSVKTNATAAASQPIYIRNGGSGALSWTLTTSTGVGSGWLTASASSGTAPSTINIGIAVASLPGGGATAGTFIGQLLLKSSVGNVTIPVAVTVGTTVFEQVNPISFSMPFGGKNPLTQILTFESTDNSAIRFTPTAYTANGGNWLSVSPSNLACCYTPYPITVSVNPGTLAAGTYTGEITIIEYANPARALTVPVTLTIAGSGAFFNDLPGGLNYSLKTNGTAITSQLVQLGNGGSGTLNWTVIPSTSDTAKWLTVSSSSGTAPSNVSVGINVSLLPGGGAIAGTYVGQLLFQTPGDTTTIPVAVTVGGSVFEQVNPISFTMPFGGANPLPQILIVESTDNSAIRFTPTAFTGQGGNWLTVSPSNLACCYTPYPVTVSVNASTLPAGTYTGEISIVEYTNPARTMNVPVTLTIASSGAFFNNLPGGLSFSFKTSGTATSQVIQIGNGGSGTLNWTVTPATSDAGAWLTVSAASGTAPSLVTVGVTASQLPNGGAIAGAFVGQLLFETAGDITTIPVTVTVGNPVFEQMNPIAFTMPFGGANPLPQVLTVESTDNSAIRFTPTASTATGGNWLSVSPSNLACCYTPNPITVAINASTLPAGVYTGEISIVEYANPARTMTVPVTLTVEASGPFFNNLPGEMSFSMKKGGTKVTPQSLYIGNGGTGTLKFTITTTTADGGAWLKPSILAGSAPKTITVSILPASLPGAGSLTGTYVGQLLVEAPGDTATINVVVTVGGGIFTQLNPLNFVMPFGGANPLPQIMTVASNDAATSLRFTPTAVTGTGGNWLSVSPNNLACCYTPNPLTVSINAPSLKAGTYTGEIIIEQYANPSLSMTVPVVLTVITSSKAFFDNLPSQTTFSFTPGAGTAATQTIHLGNGGAGTMNWSVSAKSADTGGWLKVTPTTGVNTGTYSVYLAPLSLPGKGKLAGTFLGQQVLKTPTGSVTIPVVVTVGDPVFVQLPTVTFNTTVGVNPAPQVVSVDSTSTGIRFTPYAESGKGGSWLSVSPNNLACCTTPSNITVSANASSLAAGTYYADINIIEYANPAKSMTIPVVLNVQ